MNEDARAKASRDPEGTLTALCAKEFSEFVVEAFPQIVTQEPFQNNWHIECVCDHLEALARGEFSNLLINIPPGCMKSLLCSVMFPAWLWIRDPTLRVINASYAESLSSRDSLATRRLVESQWYQSRWGDRFSLRDDQNVKTRWENTKGGYRIATSTGGSVTGERPDLLIVDDPHNVREAESETVRQGVVDWFNVTMPSRTGRYGNRMTIVIGQRVQEADLSADIISKGSYIHVNLPMEYEPDTTKQMWNGWADPRKEDGELLWPTRFTDAIMTARHRPPHMNAYAYAGQYQQRPAPREGGMFDPTKWQFYDREFVMVLLEAEDKCWSWDMTFKDLKVASASFVVGQPWARIGANFYLGPQVRGKMGFSDSKAAVKLGAATFPTIHWKLVEDKANGSAIIDDLNPSLGGLEAVEPKGGKDARASVVEPYQKNGNIFLPNPRNFPWVAAYIEEFRNFPNGAHDDQVDATSQAIIWMLERFNKKSEGMVTSVTRSTHRGNVERGYHDPRGEDRSERGDRK